MSVLLILLLGILELGHKVPPAQADLQLKVENLKAVKGKLYIAIYNKENGFRKPEYAYTHRIIDVNQSQINTTFQNLPVGEYSITLFQDLNENGVLDVNWAGIPKEPYGFSTNPKLMFGPPSFEDTRIKLVESPQKVIIQMK